MKKYFSESEKKIHFSVYFSELHTIYIYKRTTDSSPQNNN